MKIFSGSANKALAGKIVDILHIPLSPIEMHMFPDGEKRIQILESVVDQDTILIQSTPPPVDSNYMELFFTIDALKRSGAKSVTVVSPYMGYMRQDHVFRMGEAVSIVVIAEILETVSTTRFVAMDLHTIKIPELFHIPVTHVSALSLFAQTIKENGWHTDESVLVSPDMGGIRRIKQLSEMLAGMPFITIEKDRDLVTGAITANKMEGEIRKRALIVDDMISSGKTIAAAAQLLKKHGANEIIVFTTHPVFSKETPEILQKAPVDKVFITDTIHLSQNLHFAKLTVLPIAHLIAYALQNT